ncbi:MAG: hypothetical protein HYV07_32860 [Deltaproteobacteria bacterium]|nr:hypothetical protein [Deltaproteobacteria bacterium]
MLEDERGVPIERRAARLGFLRPELLALALCSLPTSCKETAPVCVRDGDCPLGATCVKVEGKSTGTCACETDEACKVGEFCNSARICQRKTGCRANSECGEPGTFCDVPSGICLPTNVECTTTAHCPLGTVCDSATHECFPGCFTHGDCLLGSSCDRRGVVDAHVLGACVVGCDEKSFCEFGDYCVEGRCAPDDHPYRCEPCSASDPDRCGSDPRIFCLVNGLHDPMRPETGSSEYCAPSCVSNGDCPYGYFCVDIRVIPPHAICTSPADCGGRACIMGEGETQGGCACQVDADCNPAPVCRPDKRCERDPSVTCDLDVDCVCRDRRCVGNGRLCSTDDDCMLVCAQGSCLVGRACALLEGLVCPDVRP